MFVLLLLNLFFLSHSIGVEPLVWIHVRLFLDPFSGDTRHCTASKSLLFNRERMTDVVLVRYLGRNESDQCNCLCKSVSVIDSEKPLNSHAKRPESFYLSHFDGYLEDEVYPDVICLPEYHCVVTRRPGSLHFETIRRLVDEVESSARVGSCLDDANEKGIIREKSDLCFYLKDKADCRPPQSFLEKVIRNQRDWYMRRRENIRMQGYFSELDHFVVESALS